MLAHILAMALVAVPISTRHDTALKLGPTATGGEVISAQSINAIKYTGWIYVGDVKQFVLAIEYSNDSGTAVTMDCKSALVNTGANGTGFDTHRVESTGASAPYVWSNAVSGDEEWTWTLFNVPQPFVNCGFTATAGGVDDVVTVTVSGVSP